MSALKLFVWRDPEAEAFDREDACAIASSVEEARAYLMNIQPGNYVYMLLQDPDVYEAVGGTFF